MRMITLGRYDEHLTCLLDCNTEGTFETKYSKMDQVKLVEDSL